MMNREIPSFMSEFNSRFLDYKGKTLHFVDQGVGQPIVLLHGNPTWSFLYHKMIPALSKKYRVIAPDLLGFGLSSKPDNVSFYSFRNHLYYLTGLLNSLKLQDPILVGQDWGGPLITSYAIKNKKLVSCLILMNTYIPGMEKKVPLYFSLLFRSFYSKFLIRRFDLFRKLAFGFGFYSKISNETKSRYFYPNQKSSERSAVVAFPKLIPTKESDATYPYLEEIDTELRSWEVPKLLIFSDKDIAFNHKKAKLLSQKLPQTDFYLVKGAGHYLQEDKGAEVSEVILKFLKHLPDNKHHRDTYTSRQPEQH